MGGRPVVDDEAAQVRRSVSGVRTRHRRVQAAVEAERRFRSVDAVEYDNGDPRNTRKPRPRSSHGSRRAGVTSVVLFAEPPMVSALMTAATQQEFRPEWIITGVPLPRLRRIRAGNDQEQMAHAFGVGVLPPSTRVQSRRPVSSSGIGVTSRATTRPRSRARFRSSTWRSNTRAPLSRPTNVEKGLFAVPATGGASDGTTNFQYGFGKTVDMPYNEYTLLGTDRQPSRGGTPTSPAGRTRSRRSWARASSCTSMMPSVTATGTFQHRNRSSSTSRYRWRTFRDRRTSPRAPCRLPIRATAAR